MWDIFQLIIPILIIILLLLLLWRIRLKRLKLYKSPHLGQIEIFEKYNGEKVLATNSYVQGVSIKDKSIEKSYWYSVAENAVKHCSKKQKSQVLMLGLGANTISSLIALLNSQLNQTIIEFDEQIIQACKDFFGLDKLPNHTLIQADAYKLFSQTRNELRASSYDVIIVDIFTGNPPYISIKSNQPNFIEKVTPYLKKDGMIIFNRPAHNEQTRSDGQKLKEYLDTLFKTTQIFDIKDPRGFRNYVITAQDLK